MPPLSEAPVVLRNSSDTSTDSYVQFDAASPSPYDLLADFGDMGVSEPAAPSTPDPSDVTEGEDPAEPETEPAAPPVAATVRQVWDCVKVMHQHDADVYCVAYDSGSQSLLTGSADNCVMHMAV